MYKIKRGTFNKYKKLRTKEYLETPYAKAIMNGDNYFIVEKNGEYLTEFLVYSDTNVFACPDRNIFFKAQLIKEVMDILKANNYKYIVIYIPIEEKEKIDYIDNKYKIMKKKVEQGGYQYFEYKIYI